MKQWRIAICLAVYAIAITGSMSLAQEEPKTDVIEEIVVSAQKKEENAQQVPIAMTVLNPEDLENLKLERATEIAAQVPNLQIRQRSKSMPNIFLRGVGINELNVNANGPVGLYVDEVYLGSGTGQGLLLFDMERIEVLRGPQGTLYGKNTTGGAVNFVSKKPTGKREHYLGTTIGRYEQLDFQGALETTLANDKIFARVAFMSDNRDGYLDNLFDGGTENDRDNIAARALIQFNVNDDTKVLLNLHTARNRSGGEQTQNIGLIDGADAFGYVNTPDVHTGAWDYDDQEDIDTSGGYVKIDYTSDAYTFTSITAFNTTERDFREDGDASPNPINHLVSISDAEQITQEFRVSSSTDRLDWVLGLYYFDEDLFNIEESDLFEVFGLPFDPTNPFGGHTVLFKDFTQGTTSYAAFGQLDYRINDKATITAGLRYSDEERTSNVSSFYSDVDRTQVITVIDNEDRKLSEGELSGRLSYSYEANDSVLWFANVSHGFKSGGFNGASFFNLEELEPVQPEHLTAWELGVKSVLWNRRAQWNNTAFYYDYKDLQVFNFVTDPVPVQILDNASDARISGLETELRVLPAQGWDLRLGAGFLDAEYRDYVQGDGTDFSGNELVSAPDLTLNGFVGYAFAPSDMGIFSFNADFNYTGERFFNSANTERISGDSYTLYNARLAYETPSSRFILALFGKNLSDEVYRTDGIDFSFLGYDTFDYGEPRTYGVEIKTRF